MLAMRFKKLNACFLLGARKSFLIVYSWKFLEFIAKKIEFENQNGKVYRKLETDLNDLKLYI
jgi:hypothetical protein